MQQCGEISCWSACTLNKSLKWAQVRRSGAAENQVKFKLRNSRRLHDSFHTHIPPPTPSLALAVILVQL